MKMFSRNRKSLGVVSRTKDINFYSNFCCLAEFSLWNLLAAAAAAAASFNQLNTRSGLSIPKPTLIVEIEQSGTL